MRLQIMLLIKNIPSLLTVILINSYVFNQDTIIDPLQKFDIFLENSLSLNAARVNTNYTEFNTSDGDFDFRKNDYLLTVDGSFNIGWLFKKSDKHNIWSLKTGVNLYTRRANLSDQDGNDLRLVTNYLTIPVQYGTRYPLKFNTVKNDLFRAIEYNIGGYISSPFYQKLDLKNNIDSAGKYSWFNYLRFGFVSEFIFTAFNQNGNGHKFGIRTSTDLAYLTKIRDTENELYPNYINIGVFYNITNDYYKRKKKE